MFVELRELAYARSGDKGDVVNIGLMAKSRRIYDRLCELITPEAVRAHYGSWVKGDVEVHRAANLDSLVIILRRGLGGGATTTLRYDQTGKAVGTAILRMQVDVSDELVAEARRRTAEIEQR
ncbi:MAG: hypothetical protein AB7O24_28450 [Kofleriaceae bacterium]